MQKDLDIIHAELHNLRSEIKNGKTKFVGSENFPIGCCGNASLILFERLKKIGIKNLKNVVNMFNDEQSHAWIEYSEYIIDITIDQFEDDNVKFIIQKKNSEFHKKFSKWI